MGLKLASSNHLVCSAEYGSNRCHGSINSCMVDWGSLGIAKDIKYYNINNLQIMVLTSLSPKDLNSRVTK